MKFFTSIYYVQITCRYCYLYFKIIRLHQCNNFTAGIKYHTSYTYHFNDYYNILRYIYIYTYFLSPPFYERLCIVDAAEYFKRRAINVLALGKNDRCTLRNNTSIPDDDLITLMRSSFFFFPKTNIWRPITYFTMSFRWRIRPVIKMMYANHSIRITFKCARRLGKSIRRCANRKFARIRTKKRK